MCWTYSHVYSRGNLARRCKDGYEPLGCDVLLADGNKVCFKAKFGGRTIEYLNLRNLDHLEFIMLDCTAPQWLDSVKLLLWNVQPQSCSHAGKFTYISHWKCFTLGWFLDWYTFQTNAASEVVSDDLEDIPESYSPQAEVN